VGLWAGAGAGAGAGCVLVRFLGVRWWVVGKLVVGFVV
jgi:hypothetical protein